jgi:uncharacterized Zn finger protein
MPTQPCPKCGADAPRQLGLESHVVTYYRCPECGHVWTVRKDDQRVEHVTPPPRATA